MKGIGKLILVGLGLAVFAGIVYKKYKEEEKKIKKEEKLISEELENHGIAKEDLDRVPGSSNLNSEQFENSDNLVLKMYNVVENGSDELGIDPWDRDLIKIRTKRDKRGKIIGNVGCLDCENIIHVKQSDIRGQEHLEFIFEIPSSAYDDRAFNSLKIRDYTESFHDAARYINKEILGLDEIEDEKTGRPKVPFECHVMGYYLVSYKIKGVEEVDENGELQPKKFQKMIPINRSDCNRFISTSDRRERLNDTEKYVKYLYKHIKDGPIGGFENGIVDVMFFSKEVEKLHGEYYDLAIEFPFLMFRMAIPIINETNSEGVDLEKALDCLRYFTDDLVIRKANKVYQDFQDLSGPGYDHVLFHAKDLDHLGRVGFDMLQYYTVTCEDIDKDEFRYRKLIVEPLVYERDLKEKSQNEKN